MVGFVDLKRFDTPDEVRVFEKGRLAASNAELVKRVADLCGKYNRHPATPKEARALLGLRAA